MKERYRAFVSRYRLASERFRAGQEARFPEGCFPPAGPFVPYSRAGPSSERSPFVTHHRRRSRTNRRRSPVRHAP